MRPHRQQPTMLPCPWDSPGKNTGVGCHFLLQCRKVKSKSEVSQSCLTPSDPMDCSLPGSSIHGIFQARVLESGCHCSLTTTIYTDSLSTERDIERGPPACSNSLPFSMHGHHGQSDVSFRCVPRNMLSASVCPAAVTCTCIMHVRLCWSSGCSETTVPAWTSQRPP